MLFVRVTVAHFKFLFVVPEDVSSERPVLRSPSSAELLQMLQQIRRAEEVSSGSPVLKRNRPPSLKLLNMFKTSVRGAKAKATF